MAYSKDLREKSIGYYKDKENASSIRKTAKIFGVAARTFQNWLELDKKSISLEPRKSTGRPRKLSTKQEQRVRELIEEHCDWSQARYGAFLTEEFGMEVSQVLISGTIARLGITFKKKNGERMRQKVRE